MRVSPRLLVAPVMILRSRGLTLIELLTTMLLAVVLLTLAVPSFVAQMNRYRATIAANELLATLQYARGQAANLGMTVEICPSAAPPTCVDTHSWDGGWMVYVGNGQVQPLRIFNEMPSVEVTGPKLVEFSSVGSAASGAQFTVEAGDADIRYVCLEITGRSEIQINAECQ